MLGLTYIRNAYAFSMQELAEKLAISKQTVSKWEKGNKKIPQRRIKQMSEEIFKGIPQDYYTRELGRAEQLAVQKKKIETEVSDKIMYYSMLMEFDLEDTSIFRQKPIYESDLLDLEMEKEAIIDEFRLILNKVTPEDFTPLVTIKALCAYLADDIRLNGLKRLLKEVENLGDEELRIDANWLLWRFKMM
jgi:transcriptional regulator with XRE-family HTH domain